MHQQLYRDVRFTENEAEMTALMDEEQLVFPLTLRSHIPGLRPGSLVIKCAADLRAVATVYLDSIYIGVDGYVWVRDVEMRGVCAETGVPRALWNVGSMSSYRTGQMWKPQGLTQSQREEIEEYGDYIGWRWSPEAGEDSMDFAALFPGSRFNDSGQGTLNLDDFVQFAKNWHAGDI